MRFMAHDADDRPPLRRLWHIDDKRAHRTRFEAKITTERSNEGAGHIEAKPSASGAFLEWLEQVFARTGSRPRVGHAERHDILLFDDANRDARVRHRLQRAQAVLRQVQ